MKKCKYCQSEIDDKAKICPNCNKKQGPKVLKWVILIIIIAIIGGAVSGGKKENTPIKKDYMQNEVAKYKDIEYSIKKVERTKGNSDWIKPKKGYEYVKVTLKIENKSDEKISYNALDWQMVNADGVEDAWGTYTADEDTILSSGELDAGGKIEGVLIWEEKIGDNNLRLRYYDDLLMDNNYTLQFKLDNKK